MYLSLWAIAAAHKRANIYSDPVKWYSCQDSVEERILDQEVMPMEFKAICNTSEIENCYDVHQSNRSNGNINNQFQEDLYATVSPVLFVFRWLAFCIGVPIQLLVAIVILKSRRLHNPRNAFCLGNICCCFSILTMSAYEYLLLIYRPNCPLWCQIYGVLVGSPYTSLLVTIFWAIIDRWFAISFPIKHRKHVTVFRVAVCLVTSWILVLVMNTSSYWLGRNQISISCTVNSDIMKWVSLSHLALVGLIIVAQVAVYIRTRNYLRFNAQLSMRYKHSKTRKNSTLEADEYFVHLPNKTICRLELEASVTLVCGVTCLCVSALPLATTFLALIICQIHVSHLNCNHPTFIAFIPYVRDMLLLHVVIGPILYITRSREFSKALRRTLPFRLFIRRLSHRQRVVPSLIQRF